MEPTRPHTRGRGEVPLSSASMADRELMAEAGAGHIDAFDELYWRYRRRAFQTASSVCHDEGEAEDAVQEAFLAVWKSTASYDSHRGSVAAWLLTVVRYRAIDVARRNRATTVAPDREIDPGWRRNADDAGHGILRREQREDLQVLLSRLPDARHEVIDLAFYGELSHAEIADRLQLPAGTVKGRMRLGMAKLRASLTTADR
jgi:RNA polymerase sigma-70 factor, ECF subfamily